MAAIAAGGALVTSILARGYPDWMVGSLSGIFIIVGFTMMFVGVRRYNQIIQSFGGEQPYPMWLLILMTILLQAAIIVVLILFLAN